VIVEGPDPPSLLTSIMSVCAHDMSKVLGRIGAQYTANITCTLASGAVIVLPATTPLTIAIPVCNPGESVGFDLVSCTTHAGPRATRDTPCAQL
jgi:hypothetical protein